MGSETTTAHRHWDETWRVDQGGVDYEHPDPWVTGMLPLLRRRGVRRVLDLGCGIGRHAVYFAENGLESHGIDASAAGVGYAREAAGRAGVSVDFKVGGFSRLPWPDGQFDYVLAFHVLYHGDMDAVSHGIGEVRRVLAPGGLFQTTMLSVRNAEYGKGERIGPGTYRQPDATDDKVHPHFYCDARKLVELHRGMELISAFDTEDGRDEGTYHWRCVFEVPAAGG